jgi:hypothetical protein
MRVVGVMSIVTLIQTVISRSLPIELLALARRWRVNFVPPQLDKALAAELVADGLDRARFVDLKFDIRDPLWRLGGPSMINEEVVRRAKHATYNHVITTIEEANCVRVLRFKADGTRAADDEHGPKITHYQAQMRFVLIPIPFDEQE